MVRVKHRYLLVEYILPVNAVLVGLTAFDLYKLIRYQIQKLFGAIPSGSILTALQVKYLNLQTNKLIIRCQRSNYRMVWASLTFLTRIGSIETFFRVLHVGGTIRSCQAVLIGIDQKTASDLLTLDEDDEEVASLESTEPNSTTTLLVDDEISLQPSSSSS